MKRSERRGAGLQLGKRPRHFDQRGRARRIVRRPVVDTVALHRIADSQVIEMRGENNIFVLELWIRARQNRSHVRAFHLRVAADDVHGHARGQRKGLRLTVLRRLQRVFPRLRSAFEQQRGRAGTYPRGTPDLRFRVIRHTFFIQPAQRRPSRKTHVFRKRRTLLGLACPDAENIQSLHAPRPCAISVRWKKNGRRERRAVLGGAPYSAATILPRTSTPA